MASQAPSLILLTIECWREDYFGPLTPLLSRFAEESVRFLAAQAPGGWTRISMTALMSSAYASMHGGTEIGLSTPARSVLAECLLQEGYWTGGFSTNPACGSMAGFHRGFCDYRDCTRKSTVGQEGSTSWVKNWDRLLEAGIPPRDLEWTVDARELTDRGLRWLERRDTSEPYFLWLHYLDPHWPCMMARRPSTPAELRDAWEDVDIFRTRVFPSRGTFDPGPEVRDRVIGRYRESLAFVDSEIGRLLVELRKRKDWDRTIVAITGDHGEEFFEHGSWLHGWNRLHREGVEVPLLIRVPGSAPRSVSHPVGLVDLTPTLLDFAGVRQPASMIGHSLRGMMEGDDAPVRPVFTEMSPLPEPLAFRLAIRDGDWKYIYDIADPFHSSLFNIKADPEERMDLRESRPDVFRRFEQMRLAHTAMGLTLRMKRTSVTTTEGSGPAGDEILRDQFEALGYLESGKESTDRF